MFKQKNYLLLLFGLLISLLALSTGCAGVKECGKKLWGSSTQALERARDHAKQATFTCSYDECFQAVLAISQEQEYLIFNKNQSKGYLVVMGVKGNVNTTEVGIFLTDRGDGTVGIEISSLSSLARDNVAEVLFTELNDRF